ncbi:hypothetical protein EDD85DRAFT_261836 [Armillaria nabsnona]|nr:hypothetical protein EDD85DRAFT_261836 [Armillaria nabsnona]
MTVRQNLGTATPELTDSQIKEIYVALDTQLNGTVLIALLYGIHTGIIAVTIWAVASRDNFQNNRRSHFLLVVILLLYLLVGFDLSMQWIAAILTFITNGQSFWVAYAFGNLSTPTQVAAGMAGILNTLLADATLIWRCWIVWGRSWRIVLVPIACTILATVSRGFVIYYDAFGSVENISPLALFFERGVNWAVLYSSFILATLLWCTILIVYRILRVGGAAGRIHVYQRVIEMLVESASLYSAMIIVWLVFEVRNEIVGEYVEILVVVMRGIMPTILVGHVAAGHARPDDSWSESTPRSSLRFRNQSGSQNDTQISVGSGWVTSSPKRPDVEEGLEISTEVRAEGAAPTFSAHDYSARVVGTSSSEDYSVV